MRSNRTVFALLLVGALTTLGVTGCTEGTPRSRAVFLLLDTSGTYKTEIDKAEGIANYLLGTLGSGDSLGLARIDAGSFSEKDIVARVTFDSRPSYANQQKRGFRGRLDRFVNDARSSAHTDITGAVLQATEWLNETEAGHRYILIFSDLEEDLRSIKVRYIGVLYDEFGKMGEHRYPLDAKLALIYLHDEGSENGWAVNRVPYVQGFFSWINGVMTSMYGKKNEILALATRADVESFDWTVAMEAEEALDPLVDVETALGYTD